MPGISKDKQDHLWGRRNHQEAGQRSLSRARWFHPGKKHSVKKSGKEKNAEWNFRDREKIASLVIPSIGRVKVFIIG
jgi:hypothetical protein